MDDKIVIINHFFKEKNKKVEERSKATLFEL